MRRESSLGRLCSSVLEPDSPSTVTEWFTIPDREGIQSDLAVSIHPATFDSDGDALPRLWPGHLVGRSF
jgi:hypothetical protein